MAFTGPASSLSGPSSAQILQARRIIPLGDKIAYYEEDKAPLLRMLTPSKDGRGNIRKKVAKDTKFGWLQHEGSELWATPSTTYNGASVTSITVDSTEGTLFEAGYTMYIPASGAMIYVESVNGDVLTIDSYNFSGSGVNAEITTSTDLLILGHTAEEGATSPNIVLTQTTNPYNYTEIVKTSLGATGTVSATELYGGTELQNQRLYKGIEHAKQIEYRLICGVRDLVTAGSNVSSNPKRYTGGLLDSASIGISTNDTQDTGTLTESDFNTWLESWLVWGSDQKVVLCSSTLLSQLQTFGFGKVRINDMLTKKYGFDISTWFSPYGSVALVYHKLLINDTLGKIGIGIDMKYIAYRYLNGRDTQLQLNIQANDADLEKDQYMTDMGLEFSLEKASAILRMA